jgi:hypothetical protein
MSTSTNATSANPSQTVLGQLWNGLGLPPAALAQVQLPGDHAVLPSSFAVATAAQASLGAAALAANLLWHQRQDGTDWQQVLVDRTHACLECTSHFAINGRQPDLWDKLSGLYPCGDAAQGGAGWVRIHANFEHHRDGALQLLGLPPGPDTPREAVAHALRDWQASHFEQAAADAGLEVAAARSFAQWDAHPQAAALTADLAQHGVVALQRLGDAPPRPWLQASPNGPLTRPLQGLRVLDLTRILAGPVAGRLLAAHGANVMLVNGPHLPNIAAIADTSRGKLSAQIDLRHEAGQAQLGSLLSTAQVFLQGYRPGALGQRGYSAQALAQRHPGIVVAELSAYGSTGPWAQRRGFDSLVQTATGFNLAEALANGRTQPQAMPVQILDYAAGHLLAFGIQAALWRQATQGGSWQVRVSLAGVGAWLRAMGQQADGLQATPPDVQPYLEDSPCGFGPAGQGTLTAVRHAAQFSVTPARWARPSMPPGSHPPIWPNP